MTRREYPRPVRGAISSDRRLAGQLVVQAEAWLRENPDGDASTRASCAFVIASGGDRHGDVSWEEVAEIAGMTPDEVRDALYTLKRERDARDKR
jgi:hypothetical protein